MKINKEVKNEIKKVDESIIKVDVQTHWKIGSKLTNNIKVVTSWMINNGFTKMSDFKFTGEMTEAQLRKLNKSKNGIVEIKEVKKTNKQ